MSNRRNKIASMLGNIFGRLLVLEVTGKDKHGNYLYLCQCECGKKVTKLGGDLRRGSCKSCGCFRLDIATGNSEYFEYGKHKIDPVTGEQIKKCWHCQKIKIFSKFGAYKRSKSGKASICKECSSKRSTESNRKRRYLIIEHYTNGLMSCACCEESNLEFLSIDHINGNGANHRKEIGVRLEQWLWKMGFPEGFRILCHNCNQSLGAYGYCPHNQVGGKFVNAIENYQPKGYNKLTPIQMKDIKTRALNGELQLNLASEFKVSRATICLVVNDKRGRLYNV
jgi:hypothetical protein